MEAFRIRIINRDGRIEVRDVTFSQVVQYLQGVENLGDRNAFWDRKRDVINSQGQRIRYVKNV